MSYMIIKCLVIGDGAVGKTTFLTKYCSDIFLVDYCPTVNDIHEKIVSHNEKAIKLSFNDVTGQGDFDFYREGVYKKTDYDIVLLMFALNDRMTFRHITDKWIPELIPFNLQTKVILIGTKYDIRRPDVEDHISTKEGQDLARKLHTSYIECSSLTDYNVEAIINKIINTHLKNNNIKIKGNGRWKLRNNGKCNVM